LYILISTIGSITQSSPLSDYHPPSDHLIHSIIPKSIHNSVYNQSSILTSIQSSIHNLISTFYIFSGSLNFLIDHIDILLILYSLFYFSYLVLYFVYLGLSLLVLIVDWFCLYLVSLFLGSIFSLSDSISVTLHIVYLRSSHFLFLSISLVLLDSLIFVSIVTSILLNQ